MAIPIKRYIDVGTAVIETGTGERDFSGLVFTNSAINVGSSKKSAYDAGSVITLSKDEISTHFASTTDVAKFADKYFSFSRNGRYPDVLNIAKTGIEVEEDTAETPKQTFERVLNSFNNFGAFTFLGTFTIGTTTGDLEDVATVNASFGMHYLFVVPVTSATASSASSHLSGMSGTHMVLGNPGVSEPNLAAWMAVAWAATLDYSSTNASSTLMYKNFGTEPATVETTSDANTYDGLKVNYVGLVQSHGTTRKFYQTGVNADGIDAGVYMDAAWISAEVENGWFALVDGNDKIPANATGVGMVLSMLTGVAADGISNGTILIDKMLTATQIATIATYTNNTEAASIVQSQGYFIDAKIVVENNQYICQYILVYAKGDHIHKVVGTHALV